MGDLTHLYNHLINSLKQFLQSKAKSATEMATVHQRGQVKHDAYQAGRAHAYRDVLSWLETFLRR